MITTWGIRLGLFTVIALVFWIIAEIAVEMTTPLSEDERSEDWEDETFN